MNGLSCLADSYLDGSDDVIILANRAFALTGLASSKPGQIYLVNEDGTPRPSAHFPTPWGGYEAFENGAAGSTGQGTRAWFGAPAGAGAARTVLTGEPGWFNGACAIETGTATTGAYTFEQGSAVGVSLSASSGENNFDMTWSLPVASDGTNRFGGWWGYGDNADPFLIQNGAFLRYRDDTNGGRFQFVTAKGGVTTAVDTGITFVAGSYYHIRVQFIDDTTANAWIKVIYDASAGSPAFADDGVWGDPQWTITDTIPSGTGQRMFSGCSIKKTAGTTSRKMKVGYLRDRRAPNFAGDLSVAGPPGTCLRTDETGSWTWYPPHRIAHPIVFHALCRGGFIPSAPAEMGPEVGNGGSASAPAVDNGWLGTTSLNTGGTTTSGYAAYRTAYNLNLDASVDPMIIEGVLDVPTLSTGVETHLVGLGLFDQVSAAYNNGITVELDSNSNTHFVVRSRTGGGTPVTVDTGITAVAGTQYIGRLVITATGADVYLKAEGAGAFGAPVASITTSLPGAANMAAGMFIRKSAGTTNRSARFVYIQAYQRSSTWTPTAQSGDISLSVAAAGFGRSRGAGAGTYDQGMLLAIEDDNSNAGTTPVATFGVPNPRTHLWAMLQTDHINLWGSNDLSALGDESGSDDAHPMCWSPGATAAPGHVGVGSSSAGVVFSATSHLRIADAMFKLPVLSDATNTHNGRFAWASALFGTVAQGAYAEIDSNTSPEMQAVCRAASAETRLSTGVTIEADTFYRVRCEMTKNTQFDVTVAKESDPWPTSPSASVTSHIPSGTSQATMHNFLIEKTAGTSTIKMPTFYFLVGVDRLAA